MLVDGPVRESSHPRPDCGDRPLIAAIHAQIHHYKLTDEPRFGWILGLIAILLTNDLRRWCQRTECSVRRPLREIRRGGPRRRRHPFGPAADVENSVAPTIRPRPQHRRIDTWTRRTLGPGAAIGDAGGEQERVVALVEGEEQERLIRDIGVRPERHSFLVAAVPPADLLPTEEAPNPLPDLVNTRKITLVVLNREAQSLDEIVAQAASVHSRGARIRTLSLFYDGVARQAPAVRARTHRLAVRHQRDPPAVYARMKRFLDVSLGIWAYHLSSSSSRSLLSPTWRQSGSAVLPPGAGRQGRGRLHDPQVPHHATDDRADGLDDGGRRPAHQGGKDIAEAAPRRAAAGVERPSSGALHRRPAPRATSICRPVERSDPLLRHSPPRSPRDHRLGTGEVRLWGERAGPPSRNSSTSSITCVTRASASISASSGEPCVPSSVGKVAKGQLREAAAGLRGARGLRFDDVDRPLCLKRRERAHREASRLTVPAGKRARDRFPATCDVRSPRRQPSRDLPAPGLDAAKRPGAPSGRRMPKSVSTCSVCLESAATEDAVARVRGAFSLAPGRRRRRRPARLPPLPPGVRPSRRRRRAGVARIASPTVASSSCSCFATS